MGVTFSEKLKLVYVFTSILVINIANSKEIDCSSCINPDYTDTNYRQHDCDNLCPKAAKGQSSELDYLQDDIEGLSTELRTVKILLVVILVLFLFSICVVVFLLLRNTKLTCFLNKVWKKRKDFEVDSEKCQPGADLQLTVKTGNLKHSSSTPVQECLEEREVHIDETTPRKRSPSESTCPDESQTIDGYDNLGLSSSTITFHSRPSSPGSPIVGNTSLATLNTTMTTVHLDSVQRSPDINVDR